MTDFPSMKFPRLTVVGRKTGRVADANPNIQAQNLQYLSDAWEKRHMFGHYLKDSIAKPPQQEMAEVLKRKISFTKKH